MSWRVVLVVLALCVPLVSWSQQQSVAPGINDYYQDPDYEQWRLTFERPGREVYDHRHRIVESLALEPGMDVADVGSGTGFFSLLFAQAVGPKGTVYAVDISQPFIDGTLARARAEGLDNVVGIRNSQTSTELPKNSVDRVFVSDTYHHFEFPQQMLASIDEALRSGGELVIVDFRKEQGVSSSWVMGHVRADEQRVIDEVTAAGFEFAGREAFLQRNYYLRFRQP